MNSDLPFPGKWTLTFPVNILLIAIVVGSAVPFNMYALGYTTTDSIGMAMPYDANATKAYERMIEEFGYGKGLPYRMLIIPNDNRTVSVETKASDYHPSPLHPFCPSLF